MGDWQTLLPSLGKLLIAAVIGAGIGFERESHGQAAGLRTNILVCLGACLMMLLSLYMADLHAALPGVESVVRVDPSRIASYAIASMGFLGAGAIITGKGSVRGLTTAAGLWLVTGMGLAVGAGFILPAVFTALVSLLSLYGLRRLKSLFHHHAHTRLTLRFQGVGEHLQPVKKILADHEITINFIAYERDLAADQSCYRLHLESSELLPWDHLVQEISASPRLLALDWEEGRVP